MCSLDLIEMIGACFRSGVGECLDAARWGLALSGSFDSVTGSLREPTTALRMTIQSRAADGSVRPTRVEEMPGFAVGFPAGALAVVARVQTQAFVGGEGFYGQDVPDVEGKDMDGQGVDIVGGVGHFAFAVDAVDGLDVIAAGAHHLGALYLYTPEAEAGIEDEVVALAVAPGLGQVEAQGFALEEESGFGEFSGALGVAVNGRASGRSGGCGQGLHKDIWAPFGSGKNEKAQLWAAPLFMFIDID